MSALPQWALYAFVVALPFHNLAMAALWDLGVRDVALDVVSAWKEVLLALALGAIVWRRRGIPFKSTSTDWLALVYTAFVLLYAVIPQDWLGGDATARGVLYGVRHDLTPVAAYFLGRGITLSHDDRRRLGYAILAAAGVVAAWGLVDIYAISLQTWRDSGRAWLVPRAARARLRQRPFRPAGELALQQRRRAAAAPARLDVPQPARDRLHAARRDPARRHLAALSPAVGAHRPARDRAALHVLAHLDRGADGRARRPRIRPAQLVAGGRRRRLPRGCLLLRPRLSGHRAGGALHAGRAEDPARGGPAGADERRPARPGRGVVRQPPRQPPGGDQDRRTHPQGYGIGNAGVTAKRTGTEIKAGESTYTELGVELGLLGMLVFIAWSVALLRVTLRRAPWLGASLAAVLVLGIQTDVIGVHWLAFVLWTLAGERA